MAVKRSASESNIYFKYKKHTDPPQPLRGTTEPYGSIVDSVNDRFRTDVLLNAKMMEEFNELQEQRILTRSKSHGSPVSSPRTNSQIAQKSRQYDLSWLSQFFLDTTVLVHYNHLIREKLNQSGLLRITPYLLYIFRRILQLISITLISLFLIILYAMYNNSDKINIPSKLQEVPESLENIKTIVLDEFVASILNETDRAFSRLTESSLQPANDLLNQAKNDKNLIIKPKHPIVAFPGISSNSLELWQSDIEHDKYLNEECKNYIKWNMRQRIWGSAHCLTEMIRSPKCWMYHMMLNETTGLDPDGIKLRSIPGAAGADYLFPGYWVWALLLDNLVYLGYDSNMIYFANYDWRLSPHKLNVRDAHWTRVKHEIEIRVKLSGEKAILIGHSMGCNMIQYFMQWVTSSHPEGGHGGKDWIDKYIESFIPIGGPLLGAPKVIPMYLFGEALETALMPEPLRRFKERFIPRTWFNRWVRSNHVWGNSTYSVEDEFDQNEEARSFGNILNYVKGEPIYSNCHLQEAAVVEIDLSGNGQIDFLVEINENGYHEIYDNRSCSSEQYSDENDDNTKPHPFDYDRICCKKPTESEENIIESLSKNYTISNWMQILKIVDKRTYGHLLTTMELSAPSKDEDLSDDAKYDKPKYFGNALYRPLPYAPNMTVYCMYGTDLRTGRNYYFMRDFNASFKYPFRINVNHNDPSQNIVNGFRTVNGDGTVPLLSLGFMCAKGWRNNERLNPAKSRTKIIEYKDKKESIFSRGTMRGGKWSGDHVDIMGNQLLIKNILLIATGYGNDEYVPEIINSNIIEMSALIDL